MEKRELLKKILTELKLKYEAEEELNSFLKKSRLFFDPHMTLSGRLDGLLVKSLVFLVKGKEDEGLEDTVFWWMLEMDFGKHFEIGDLIDGDSPEGEDTPDLTTMEKFLDYILLKG